MSLKRCKSCLKIHVPSVDICDACGHMEFTPYIEGETKKIAELIKEKSVKKEEIDESKEETKKPSKKK